MKKKKKHKKKEEWEICGYYYDGKNTPETHLVKSDGSGKIKRIKGIL